MQQLRYAHEVRAISEVPNDRLVEHIEEKVAGQEISIVQSGTPKAKVIDLMDALKASLSGGGAAAGDEEDAPAKKSDRKPAKSADRKKAKKAPAKKKSSKKTASGVAPPHRTSRTSRPACSRPAVSTR
jgi:DNA end-binding protein Ku